MLREVQLAAGPGGITDRMRATPELHGAVRSGTAGRGPNRDRWPRAPRKLRINACTSRHRRPQDPLGTAAASGPEELRDSERTYASTHAYLGTAGRGTRKRTVGCERAGRAA